MFKPWISSAYQNQNLKILVLGESHYGDHHLKYGYELSMKTILCIEDQVRWNNSYRIYTKLASAFLGFRPTFEQKPAFWDSVSYHNLITTLLPTSRQAPTHEQWVESLATLPQLIEDLRPKYVVVMGYRMWHRISSMAEMQACNNHPDVGPCGLRRFGDSYFHGIMHPSSRFSPPVWHNHIQAAKQFILAASQ